MKYVFEIIGLGLILALSNCGSTKAYQYELSSGYRVNCRLLQIQECGITLLNCDDGFSYMCQRNVKIRD